MSRPGVQQRSIPWWRSSASQALLWLGLTVILRSQAQPLAQIPDAEFWRLVTELSEPGDVFPPQLMSNEDSAQFVTPGHSYSRGTRQVAHVPVPNRRMPRARGGRSHSVVSGPVCGRAITAQRERLT